MAIENGWIDLVLTEILPNVNSDNVGLIYLSLSLITLIPLGIPHYQLQLKLTKCTWLMLF